MQDELILQAKTAGEARYRASYGSYLDLRADLTEHREAVGLTQAQVASVLGISQPAISNFEGSNSSATMVSTLISYAAAIGLEIEFTIKKADCPDLPQD